jgi:hypothetical protein
LTCAILSLAAASAWATGTVSETKGFSAGQAAAGKLALKGTWTGHRERISSDTGYRNGTATLRVTQQTGLTFKATMTWSTADGPITEPLIGAYTPRGHLMSGADKTGTYTFSLVNRKTLDYCYVEHEDGYRTNCGRLRKQP